MEDTENTYVGHNGRRYRYRRSNEGYWVRETSAGGTYWYGTSTVHPDDIPQDRALLDRLIAEEKEREEWLEGKDG